MSTPRVGKFLDASTDHLTEDDLMILEQHQEEHGDVDRDVTLPRIIPHRYGWWINVQWQDTEQCVKDRAAFKERMSLGFRKLFTRAVDEECDWINLDRDA